MSDNRYWDYKRPRFENPSTSAAALSSQAHLKNQQNADPLTGISRYCLHYLSGQCRHGPSCIKTHPDLSEVVRLRNLLKTRICPFGDNCTNERCPFGHDPSVCTPLPAELGRGKGTYYRPASVVDNYAQLEASGLPKDICVKYLAGRCEKADCVRRHPHKKELCDYRKELSLFTCNSGSSCRVLKCFLWHPDDRNRSIRSQGSQTCIDYLLGQCVLLDRCPLKHLDGEEAANFITMLRNTPCVAGASCDNSDCLYAHEGFGSWANAHKVNIKNVTGIEAPSAFGPPASLGLPVTAVPVGKGQGKRDQRPERDQHPLMKLNVFKKMHEERKQM
jgi:hypothetical protein